MRPITITRTLAAADVDSVSLAQTRVGAGNLTIDGVLAASGVATIATPARVTLTSTANLSALTFTITGTDYRGQVISETISGPNNNTVTTLTTFATVTQVAVSATVATAVSIGTSQSGASQVIPIDQYISPDNVSLFLTISGTTDVTLQYTGDDIFTTGSFDSLLWFNHSALTNATASAVGTTISPVTGIRLMTNSGGGTASLRVIQAGLQ